MKRLQLSTLKDGARFVYGGVEWVKLEHLYTESGKLETVAIAAEPVLDKVEEAAQDTIDKRVEHEITRILNGYGR